MPHKPCMAEFHAYFEHVMPGEHERVKLEAVMRPAYEGDVEDGASTNHEVDDLCRALCVDRGTVFFPWGWGDGATEAM